MELRVTQPFGATDLPALVLVPAPFTRGCGTGGRRLRCRKGGVETGAPLHAGGPDPGSPVSRGVPCSKPCERFGQERLDEAGGVLNANKSPSC